VQPSPYQKQIVSAPHTKCRNHPFWWDHCGRDRMVVGFTTTYAIGASPLTLLVWISLRRGVLDTTLCDKVCQWLAAGLWFSPGSSTNKTARHNITNIVESGIKHHNPNPFWHLQTNDDKPMTYYDCTHKKGIEKQDILTIKLFTFYFCFSLMSIKISLLQ
jgi:hypothetical protein